MKMYYIEFKHCDDNYKWCAYIHAKSKCDAVDKLIRYRKTDKIRLYIIDEVNGIKETDL